MFAPHCPTCDRRVLLGTGRIAVAALDTSPHTLLLRCFCGTLVDAFQESAPTGTATTSPPSPGGARRRAA